MFATHLKCLSCEKLFDLDILYNCPNCGGILDVQYDYDKLILDENNRKYPIAEEGVGVWKFNRLLPVPELSQIISMGEGRTELIKSPKLVSEFGLRDLYLKDETTNPTGSFKARPISVAITKAKATNTEMVITASSGNAGSAVASYATAAGLKSSILVPEHTSQEKLIQMQICGATVIKVKGDYSECFTLAKQASENFNWINITSTFLNPYATEGNKTVAYEIFEQLEYKTPDWVIIPIGAGPLLYGCYKGFKELQMLGLISDLPAMVGIQAEGCAPVVRAFRKGENEVKAWEDAHTIATGIADPLRGYSRDGTLTLKTIRESGGKAISVDEESIIDGTKFLAARTGIFAEPTGAISIPALNKLLDNRSVKKEDTVVCVITGSGYKDIQTISQLVNNPVVIDPKMTELIAVLQNTKI